MAINVAFALIAATLVCTHGASIKEGEELAIELATAVMDNKQEALSIPWEIVKHMDVGWIGGYSIADEAKTEVQVGSLNTTREQQGFNPDVIIGTVKSKGSSLPAYPPPSFRAGGKGGKELKHLNGVVNPTSELTVLGWQKNRWSATKSWLEYWVDQRGVPNKLMVIHSGGDILYGGCSEGTLKNKYQQVIDASDGTQKIVAAAEVSPYPWDLGFRYKKTSWTETRRTQVLADFNVAEDWAATYADCSSGVDGPCGSPPKYQFANSGFLMGRAVDILEMFAGFESYSGAENRFVNDYYLKHPDKMTVDYAGILAMSLHNMAKDGNLPVEVSTNADGAKQLKSKVTGEQVCFVHGGGNSFAELKGLAQEIRA